MLCRMHVGTSFGIDDMTKIYPFFEQLFNQVQFGQNDHYFLTLPDQLWLLVSHKSLIQPHSLTTFC